MQEHTTEAYPSSSYKYSTWVGSGLACRYLTKVEVLDSDEHSSLLQYGINYGRKKFYSKCSRGLNHKTYYGRNLRFP
jgi:hypothetical protein